MKTLIAISALAALTSGCSLIGKPVVDKVADAVDTYCEEPQQARELYRAMVNAELAADGHTIVVTCQGDTPE